MTNSSPLFSIIIPTYNRAHLIGKTIQSVLRQDFVDFEILIIDDSSDDDTEQVVSALGDNRIYYYKKQNAERGAARNYGTARARGQYINYFDSDDIMYPDRLQRVFHWIQANNDPEIVYTHYHVINETGEVIGKTDRFFTSFTKDILFNNFLACGSVFLKRHIAEKYLFNERREIVTAEDWELWLRLHVKYEFSECSLITFALLQHSGRSLSNVSLERVKGRELCLIQVIDDDPLLRQKYGSALNLFISDRYTFIALTLAENGARFESLIYLTRSFLSSFQIVKRKRFWGTIKTIVWSIKKGY